MRMNTNELPPEVVAALREYLSFRSQVLLSEHEMRALEAAGQCDLVAQEEFKLEHLKKVQQRAREKLNRLISIKRISSEDIVKALH